MDILNWLIAIGTIVVCLGLALIGVQFLGAMIMFIAALVWGLVSAIVKFLTTKH